MNIHQVATPELSAEDAKSYVFFFREGGRYVSYIGLHFVRTDRKLYYSHSANPFSESELPEVEDEARSFAEGMGAMLDELGLAKMSDMEKDRWIDEQDIFSSKQKTVEQPATADAAQLQQAEQSTPVAPPVPGAQPTGPSAAAEKTVPVQPAPAPQPAPAKAPASTEGIAPVRQSTVSRPEPAQSMPAPVPAPVEQPQVQAPEQSREPSRPQRKQAAAPRQPVGDVMEQAVSAGIIKAPKPQLKKDVLSSANVTGREKEALARLLASF